MPGAGAGGPVRAVARVVEWTGPPDAAQPQAGMRVVFDPGTDEDRELLAAIARHLARQARHVAAASAADRRLAAHGVEPTRALVPPPAADLAARGEEPPAPTPQTPAAPAARRTRAPASDRAEHTASRPPPPAPLRAEAASSPRQERPVHFLDLSVDWNRILRIAALCTLIAVGVYLMAYALSSGGSR
jgi:hypothetical protein